jgi:hypothetical protein
VEQGGHLFVQSSAQSVEAQLGLIAKQLELHFGFNFEYPLGGRRIERGGHMFVQSSAPSVEAQLGLTAKQLELDLRFNFDYLLGGHRVERGEHLFVQSSIQCRSAVVLHCRKIEFDFGFHWD